MFTNRSNLVGDMPEFDRIILLARSGTQKDAPPCRVKKFALWIVGAKPKER